MRAVNNIKKSSGFSLVELAVVVVIIGMILTMGIKLASSFQDRSAMSLTHSKQLAIKQALISYLAVNGRLPCPASGTALTGKEDPTPSTGTCNTPIGIIPFQTLQLPRDFVIDGWDRFFTYEAWWGDTPATYCTIVPNNANYTSDTRFLGIPNNPRTYHDGDGGCISVLDTQINGTVIATRHVVATIVSHGENGFGGFSSKGVQVDYSTVLATDPEKDNIAGYPSRTPHSFHTEPFNDKFDDMVLEISPSDLVDPLKQDGTIVSINQLARNQLMAIKAGFVNNPPITTTDCQLVPLTLPPYTIRQLNGNSTNTGSTYPGLNVTFASTAPVFIASTTISASDYKDSGGVQCTAIRTP